MPPRGPPERAGSPDLSLELIYAVKPGHFWAGSYGIENRDPTP